MNKQKLIVLTGPTAVGKSKLSIELAGKIGGEIISADSMQVYKYMNIGTDKISPEKMDGVVHHLIDFVEPDENFSVSVFSDMSKEKIKEVSSRGKLPIVTGGTGLFIKSLLYPMGFGNTDKNDSVRQKWERYLENNGKEKLYECLKNVDPESAENIEMNNKKSHFRH